MSKRICGLCGKEATGYASVWSAATGMTWFCHPDDDDLSCYEVTSIGSTLPRTYTINLRRTDDA